MERYTLKKSLGQHFLKDENIIQKIIKSVPVSENDNLLEIGPGGGALTKEWLKYHHLNFKAIEIDKEKVSYLLKKYPTLKGKLIHKDFLKTPPPFERKFHVVGNFPYVISSQILFKMLEWRGQVTSMVGMFQKEVAKRIVANPGNKNYGILSVLIGAFFEIEYLFEVPPNCFTPPPKVQSAVIRLTPTGNRYHIEDEKAFKLIVKKAFQQRRKVLRNPLKSYFCNEILKEPIFAKRAEQLSIAQFVELSKRISCRKKTSEKS